MKTNIKPIDNSKLTIAVVVREYINEKGQKVNEVKWVQADEEVNLGSCAKPNKEVVAFKYDIPHKKSFFQKFMEGEE